MAAAYEEEKAEQNFSERIVDEILQSSSASFLHIVFSITLVPNLLVYPLNIKDALPNSKMYLPLSWKVCNHNHTSV